MRIVMRDRPVFQGTPLRIVKAMQDIAFGVEDFSVPKYIESVVDNARKFEDARLDVKGATDPHRSSPTCSAPGSGRRGSVTSKGVGHVAASHCPAWCPAGRS